MNSSSSLEDKKEEINDLVHDCIVIGTGTSSEPVIYHLSKTNLKTLIIDSSNIYKEYTKVEKRKKLISRITPKQIFSYLKIHNKNNFIRITSNVFLKCKNFSYVHSSVSGGLSNFWGGGVFKWPDLELRKATTLPVESIKKSYLNISKRLKILSRNDFLEKSYFSKFFLKEHSKNFSGIFSPTNFFVSENGLSKHKIKKEEYDQHLIWKSSHTVRRYIDDSKNIKYSPETTALVIKKHQNYYEILCSQGSKNKKLKSKSIFLCCGPVNSTQLAFSVLDLKEEIFELNHSISAITPIIHLGLLSKFKKNNLDLADLSWSLIPKGINISGSLLSSFFIHKKILKILPNGFLRNIYSLFENILSSIAFITTFTDSQQTKTSLKIKKISSENDTLEKFLLEISNNNFRSSKYYISKKLKNLSQYIKRNYLLIRFLTVNSKNGGDIHYGSTMPEKKLKKNPINTSFIGEVNKAKNIYSCDAARLSYISSLPHTYTVMAIIDASMPLIIENIEKSNKSN